MQNAQNLMSSFEFIAALTSIIIGLGVTNLLAGARRAFYRRKENRLDEVHIVLTLATLLLLALQWWVTFKWNTEVNWSFDKFLVLIAWTITLYMLTVFLYAPDLSEAEEHHGRFERNRSSDLVRSVCRLIRGAGSRWAHWPSAGLRPVFRVVPTNHAAGLGVDGETISRGERDGSLGTKRAVFSA